LAEGHTILIGTEHLGVEDACSGLRIMMSIGALTLACASVVRRPLWERLILVLSAVPIAVLANSCRIVVTGLLYQYASGEAARVFSHDLAGWLMIPLAGGLLVAEMWCLRRVMTESGPSDVKELVERERDEIAAVFQPRGLRQGESRK